MKHLEKNKPWLDKNNNPLPTEALRDVSKNWDLKTWGEYLRTMELETDRSTQISSEDFKRQADSLSLENFYEGEPDDLSAVSLYSKAEVQEALKRLKPNQAEIIGLLYFKDVPLEEVAHQKRTSSSNVLQTRDRALSDLRKILSQTPKSEGRA